jgi:pimeloyl-ACP methyl ester carboxylesterase
MQNSLILISGGPGMSSHYFEPLISSLRGSIKVFTYNHGHCKELTMDGLVDELLREISKTTEKPYILAHSFASLIVLHGIDRIQDKISGLILSHWIYDSTWAKSFLERFPDLDYESISKMSYKDRSLFYLPYYFKKEYLNQGRSLLQSVEYSEKIKDAIWESLGNEYDYCKQLTKINCPVLSISGSDDQVIVESYIKNGLANISNTSNKTIAGGHFNWIESLTEYEKELLTFIK